VEHLHKKSLAKLEQFIAAGGKVYIGGNSTLELAGAEKLPMAFDVKFNTWWPKDRRTEWNQRRVRQYEISLVLEKMRYLPKELLAYRDEAQIQLDDPEVIYAVRTAGEAQYVFVINDHQVNPTSSELRKMRQKYNHFMLMPMQFPAAAVTMTIQQSKGALYEMFSTKEAVALKGKAVALPLELAGGEGKLFVILPRPIKQVKLDAAPVRTAEGVQVTATVNDGDGAVPGSIPVQIDIAGTKQRQTVYQTTTAGKINWCVPLLRDFDKNETLTVTVTELLGKHTAKAEVKK
jgi:hypothetical protein